MMTAPLDDNDLDDSVIAQFLRDNPDFLLRHPELVARAVPDTDQGNVVDFQKLMVNRLRQDKQRAEDRHRTLINNARSNMTVQARVHAAVVRLAEAQDLDELVDIIGNELCLMLEVDVVTLALESAFGGATANSNALRSVPAGTVDAVLDKRDAVLQTNVTGDDMVFGPAARLVKSQALLRLTIDEDAPDALLAFGSRDPLLFADSQGTELIGFLGDVVERLLRRFMHDVR